MSVASYIGRTVDVLAFQNVVEGRETQLEMSLVGTADGGSVTTGIQKLAQRWLLELLTERGSIPALPDRGTLFMTAARQGRLRTTLDAEQMFYLSAAQAKVNLQLEETDDTPADEAYRSTTLDSITLVGDQLYIYATVRSQAGTDRQVILPIQTRVG